MQHNQQGFVTFSLVMILIFTALLVMFFAKQSSVYRKAMHVVTQKETCRLYEQFGPDVVCSLLIPQQEEQEGGASVKHGSDNKSLSNNMHILKTLYAYQTLKKATFPDSSAAVVYSLQLSSEDGKINLNRMYDFEKGKWASSEKQKCIKWVCEKLELQLNKKGIFTAIEAYLKKQKTYLNDVTLLLEDETLAEIFADHVFFVKENQKVALTDVFTVATNHDTLAVVNLSASLIHCMNGSILSRKSREKQEEILASLDKGAYKEIQDFMKEAYDIALESSFPKECKRLLTMQLDLSIFTIMLRTALQSTVCNAYILMQVQEDTEKKPVYTIIRKYEI